jgi:plastocyanin
LNRFAIGLAMLAVLLVAVPATTAASRKQVLQGNVGPGFTITLKKNGQKVTKVKAGKYVLSVSDKSSAHNFVFERSGGGFERAVTTVGFTGRKTLTITLKKGKYEYYCAPHESIMHGDLRVT